jgi:hypothetical protein
MCEVAVSRSLRWVPDSVQFLGVAPQPRVHLAVGEDRRTTGPRYLG